MQPGRLQDGLLSKWHFGGFFLVGAAGAPDVQRAHAELATRQRRRLWGAVQAALDTEASAGSSGQPEQDIGQLAAAPSAGAGSALQPLLLRLYLQSVDGARSLRLFSIEAAGRPKARPCCLN